MDDLNSQQIVLLTLLVSFVTSIATGIVAVSLLEQIPEPVTQTINRVVEKTVERVVEVDEETNEPQEKIVETIIVKEEDLTIEAVEKNSKSLVRVFQKAGELENFVGIGFITSDAGEILISADLISEGVSYIAKYPNATSTISVVFEPQNSSYVLLKPGEGQTIPVEFSKVVVGNSQNLKLGQSIIALSGQNSNSVTTGIITSLESQGQQLDESEVNSSTSPSSEISIINTSVDSNKVVNGALLLNLQGELVGYKRNVGLDPTVFDSVIEIRALLNSSSNQTAVSE